MTLPPLPIKQSGEMTEDESTFILDSTLKEKHRKDASVISFIDAFVRCKSVRQASEEAGIHHKIGMMYRNRRDIAQAIQKFTDKSAIKYGFDASEIYERVKEVVEFDPILVQNPDGSFKSNMHDIVPEARRCIKKLKVKNLWNTEKDMNGIEKRLIIGEVIEYEFYDKLKSADLAGKEKDLFKTTTKVEHTVTKDMANILLEAEKRGASKQKALVDETVINAEFKEVES